MVLLIKEMGLWSGGMWVLQPVVKELIVNSSSGGHADTNCDAEANYAGQASMQSVEEEESSTRVSMKSVNCECGRRHRQLDLAGDRWRQARSQQPEESSTMWEGVKQVVWRVTAVGQSQMRWRCVDQASQREETASRASRCGSGRCGGGGDKREEGERVFRPTQCRPSVCPRPDWPVVRAGPRGQKG